VLLCSYGGSKVMSLSQYKYFMILPLQEHFKKTKTDVRKRGRELKEVNI
jgi:hypothetical protein